MNYSLSKILYSFILVISIIIFGYTYKLILDNKNIIQQTITSLKNKNNKLEEQYKIKDIQVINFKKEQENISSLLSKQDREIDTIKNKLSNSILNLKNKNNELLSYQNKYIKLNTKINQKILNIENLKKDNAKLQHKLKLKQDENVKLSSKIDTLQNKPPVVNEVKIIDETKLNLVKADQIELLNKNKSLTILISKLENEKLSLENKLETNNTDLLRKQQEFKNINKNNQNTITSLNNKISVMEKEIITLKQKQSDMISSDDLIKKITLFFENGSFVSVEQKNNTSKESKLFKSFKLF